MSTPIFKAGLKFSRPAVGIAATVWTHYGYEVFIPPDQPEGPNTDSGDLFAEKDHGPMLVEVKRLTRNFKKGYWGRADTEVPFKDFIVDRCATFNKKHPTPARYMILSLDLSAYGLVDIEKHFDDLYPIKRNNKSYNCKSKYYAVDPGLVYFDNINLMMDGYENHVETVREG